jgi:hypothetical protein
LFDSVANPFGTVTVTVEVVAHEHSIDVASPQPFRARGQDVLTSTDTYGDISHYPPVASLRVGKQRLQQPDAGAQRAPDGVPLPGWMTSRFPTSTMWRIPIPPAEKTF